MHLPSCFLSLGSLQFPEFPGSMAIVGNTKRWRLHTSSQNGNGHLSVFKVTLLYVKAHVGCQQQLSSKSVIPKLGVLQTSYVPWQLEIVTTEVHHNCRSLLGKALLQGRYFLYQDRNSIKFLKQKLRQKKIKPDYWSNITVWDSPLQVYLLVGPHELSGDFFWTKDG